MITLMLKTVAKKNALNRLRGELSALMRRKQDITCASKHSKMIITRRGSMQDLSRTLALKTR